MDWICKRLHLKSSKYPFVTYIIYTKFKTQLYKIFLDKFFKIEEHIYIYRINKITNDKRYLQKKVLLPARIGPFHRDCRRLHILQLQCYVRVELFRWNRCKSVLNRVHRHVKPLSPPRAREVMRLPIDRAKRTRRVNRLPP